MSKSNDLTKTLKNTFKDLKGAVGELIESIPVGDSTAGEMVDQARREVIEIGKQAKINIIETKYELILGRENRRHESAPDTFKEKATYAINKARIALELEIEKAKVLAPNLDTLSINSSDTSSESDNDDLGVLSGQDNFTSENIITNTEVTGVTDNISEHLN